MSVESIYGFSGVVPELNGDFYLARGGQPSEPGSQTRFTTADSGLSRLEGDRNYTVTTRQTSSEDDDKKKDDKKKDDDAKPSSQKPSQSKDKPSSSSPSRSSS